jgi:hypothetical protein
MAILGRTQSTTVTAIVTVRDLYWLDMEIERTVTSGSIKQGRMGSVERETLIRSTGIYNRTDGFA